MNDSFTVLLPEVGNTYTMTLWLHNGVSEITGAWFSVSLTKRFFHAEFTLQTTAVCGIAAHYIADMFYEYGGAGSGDWASGTTQATTIGTDTLASSNAPLEVHLVSEYASSK